MPYLKAPETERLNLPSNPDYWVEMKRTASYGDKSAAQTAMVQVNQVDIAAVGPEKAHLVMADAEAERGMLTEIAIDAYMRMLLVRLIVDWNLDDEQGRKLPINEVSIDLLDGDDGDFLQRAATKRVRGRPKAVEGPFDTRSPQASAVSASTNRRPRER